MISNSSHYKLKASKSSNFQEKQSDDLDNDSVEGDSVPPDSNKKYQVYNGRDGRFRGLKPRQGEFKSNRSTERRNSYRGRGGSSGLSARRSERDYSDGGMYIISRKYQDSLRGSGTYQHSKYYENEKKSEIKFNLPEDTRISKLLRRLNIEEDPENSLTISKKLLEVLLIPDNSIYVRKAFHILSDSMLDILRVAPGPLAKSQAARALGRMGYIMGQEVDFERFQTWLFSNIPRSSDNLTYLFMKALLETLAFEKKKPVLQRPALLMREVVTTIENTDNVDVFKTGLEVLVNLVDLYPDDFYSLFRDTTDLLIGWHVDHTQQLSNIEFISKSMQKFSKYFQVNIDFSVTLLLHFMEDIETYSEQLKEGKDTDSAVEHVTVFILALNTVLKCLGVFFDPVHEHITTKFIIDCLTKIINTTTKALEAFVADNLTIAGNECISILLSVSFTKPANLCSSILSLVDLELSLIEDASDATVISIMLMIAKVIKELSANLPIELISKLLGPQSEIIKLRQSSCGGIQESTVAVYQALLNLKNIPLLQEAYRYILGDLELVYKYFIPIEPLCTNNPFTEVSCKIEQAENTVLFLFRCLSQLANVSGSIIGMWALRPSILELLGVYLQPFNEELSKSNPILQYSLLYLLFSHCKCYNYFITNSSLVTDKVNVIGHLGLPDSITMDDVGKSPNSGHFSIVLNLLYKTLLTKPSNETVLFVLNWFEDILVYAAPYLEVFYETSDFRQLAEINLLYGFKKSEEVILTVCKNLEKLLNNKRLSWPNVFLTDVNELCILHMTSNNREIRESYTKLSVNIPWDIAVRNFGKMYTIDKAKQRYGNSIRRYNVHTIVLAQHLHLYGSMYGEMIPFQFKVFMDYLLKSADYPDGWLQDVFVSCWSLENEAQSPAYTVQFYDLALKSRPVLNSWATWEAAQFCVNSKLRTPLGKPNETFTSFEASLKSALKQLLKIKENQDDETFSRKELETKLEQLRLLLQFIDHLEICIYNAAEGSAVAIPQPAKPVRTFFSTNSSTCKEWLSRIRPTVIQLALHAGLPALAYRHGQCLIRSFIETNRINSLEFDQTVIYVTLALLEMREPDSIHGLYVFCKKLGKEFPWVKYGVDQASKRYEAAAEGYKSIVSSDLPSFVKQFIYDQAIACYKQMNNFYEIMVWHDEANQNLLDYNCSRSSFNTVNLECCGSLWDLETGNRIFNELCTWTEPESTKTWTTHDVLNQSETGIFSAALNIVAREKEATLGVLEENLERVHSVMQSELLALPSENLRSYCLMNYIIHGLKNIVDNTPVSNIFLVSENFENEINKVDSWVLSRILWWSEYFAKLQNQGFSLFCSNLRLNVIKRARKERNYNLAISQLYAFLQEKDLVSPIESSNGLLVEMTNSLMQKIPDCAVWSLDTAKSIQEMIKLLYVDADNRQLTFNLCAKASTSISKCADRFGGIELRHISSKILMKLASWLQVNDHVPITEINSPLGKFLTVLPEVGNAEHASIIPLQEMAIGKLLKFSVQQCNQNLAKSWNAFGTWCYRWGRKIVDSSGELTNVLTEEDQLKIQEILPKDAKMEDLKRIYLILSQTRVSIDEEDIDSTDVNTSEMIRSQLQNVPILENSRENHIQDLVEIWKNIHKRVYSYYEIAAGAYFKYLHQTTSNEFFTSTMESNTVTITLRLLRLIVKHALELQNVLEDGLSSTPTQPWKIIIPQLFSRLNHPESYVRQRVSELLCRVAEDSPHLIMFPAVVGALEGGVKFDFSEISLPKDCLSQNNDNNDDTEDEIEDSYDSDNDDSKNILQSCFKSMVETLSKQAPETINAVQLLVKELRRIILLWDELWLGTLAQHHSEINKRQQQLETEIEKVHSNQHLTPEEKVLLIAEKHRIIIKPIIFILEQLYDITSVEPETPHEKLFQEQYSELIVDTLKKLKNPQNIGKPQESWTLLKDLQTKFQHKVHKRASYSLKMQDISPVLAAMRNTMISMPGLASSAKTRVTISHVSNHVSILPTKTKPKKLVFHGSDGHTYTYLFKGLEDLHLDERIMQFLSITNTMMAQNKDTSDSNLYRARHYSVIPLGPRSGLISWVDGTTPIFALYKRWQQREALKHNTKASASSSPVLRPSELFYNKLNPLLQEHGVKNIENRKEWPLVVLKKVLAELMKEAPSDLLANELWCHSVNASAWWQMVRRYSYSVAVMSMIGYIIGLGDRHLDNVLVDLTSGDVVHIDYNVCFEKGKALRVPEKVPFRLTPNIRDALGVGGVEGVFRLACENVLRTMKKGRETLLTLLEAFVYDPLIDWTLGVEGLAGTIFGGIPGSASSRQTRRDLEREVTLAMYNVRCMEVRVDWNKNRDDILSHLPALTEVAQRFLIEAKSFADAEETLQDLHQQMALVKEAEANGICKHRLYSLPGRYGAYRKAQDAIANATKDLDGLVKDCKARAARYADAKQLLDGPQLSQWMIEWSAKVESEGVEVFEIVKEFLQNAGQVGTVAQCEQSEKDIEHLAQQQIVMTLKCLQSLLEYAAVIQQCPETFLNKHRVCAFQSWCSYLEDTKNMAGCDLVFSEFAQFIETTNETVIKGIVKFVYQLGLAHTEMTGQYTKALDDLNKIHMNETSPTVLDRIYNDNKLSTLNFLRQEKCASSAFQFVIVNELLLVNQNFLNLERAASRCGDWLLKLPTVDSVWMLEDLTYQSDKVMEMLSYLFLINNKSTERFDETFTKIYGVIKSTNGMYKGLQELYLNFHTIILPESMKKIQCDERNVLEIVGELNSLIDSVGMPLKDIVAHLENNLKCTVMEMDISSAGDYVLDKVRDLRANFEALVHSSIEYGLGNNLGKMLLMGFNGLFQKVNVEYSNLMELLRTVDVPSAWKKIDQVKEAKSLAAPIYNPLVRAILDDIFLIKRIQAIAEFLNICVDMCRGFKGNGQCVVFNDEQIVKPVRKYIADFIGRQFLGISTEVIAYAACSLLQKLGLDVSNEIEQKDIGAENKVPFDELSQIGWNFFVKTGSFTQNILAQASSLETNLKTSWESLQEPKKLEQHLTLLQSSLKRISHQVTIANWVYEDVLIQHNWFQNGTPATRSKFVADLTAQTTALANFRSNLIEAQELQKPLIGSVEQRLKWAAGANPDLSDVLSSFESALRLREETLKSEIQVSSVVLNACHAILQHELLRGHTPESKIFDQIFLNGCDKWRTVCQFNSVKLEDVSDVEENIMKLYTPTLDGNPKWLTVVSEKISDIIAGTQSELEDLKAEKLAIIDSILVRIEKLKPLYTEHSKLMTDFRGLIKSMAKTDDYAARAQRFIVEYRAYIEGFSSLFVRTKSSIAREDIEAVVRNCFYLEKCTGVVYEKLLNLLRDGEEDAGDDGTTRNSSSSPARSVVPKQETMSRGQQRNAYAVSVWRRVRQKLEGRDPVAERKCNVQEQVEHVIREATNLDNLALLYEGWTPWV